MGADQHTARRREAFPGGREEALRVRLDRVLESAAVDLDGVGHLPTESPGEDQRPHHEVVRERGFGPGERRHLGGRGDVGGDVPRHLLGAALGEGARLKALVAVGHVHGQQAADVRTVEDRPPRALGWMRELADL